MAALALASVVTALVLVTVGNSLLQHPFNTDINWLHCHFTALTCRPGSIYRMIDLGPN